MVLLALVWTALADDGANPHAPGADELQRLVGERRRTLEALKDTSLDGDAPATRLTVRQRDLSGEHFEIVKLTWAVDGQQVFAWDPSRPPLPTELTTYDRALPDGSHSLALSYLVVERGFGIFQYDGIAPAEVSIRWQPTLSENQHCTANVDIGPPEPRARLTGAPPTPTLDLRCSESSLSPAAPSPESAAPE